jgi:hypothetical protein
MPYQPSSTPSQTTIPLIHHLTSPGDSYEIAEYGLVDSNTKIADALLHSFHSFHLSEIADKRAF